MSYNAFRRKKEFNEITERLYKDNHITEKEKKLLDYEIRRSEFMKTMNKRGKKMDTALVKQATQEVIKKEKGKKGITLPDPINDQIINHIQNVNKIIKPVLDQPNSIKRCINEYFNLCKADKVRPSVAGLAMAIGVNRLTLLDWANGTRRFQNQEVIQKALQMIEMFVETSMLRGAINPVPALFLMKNNHGYKDESNVKISNDKDNVSAEDLRKKYMEEETIVDGEVVEKQ